MKEKVQSILSWEERVSSCTLSTGLPGRCIVVAIPCGRHAWADHHTRFHSQSHSPTKSFKYRFFGTPPKGASGGRKSGAAPLDPAFKKSTSESSPPCQASRPCAGHSSLHASHSPTHRGC